MAKKIFRQAVQRLWRVDCGMKCTAISAMNYLACESVEIFQTAKGSVLSFTLGFPPCRARDERVFLFNIKFSTDGDISSN